MSQRLNANPESGWILKGLLILIGLPVVAILLVIALLTLLLCIIYPPLAIMGVVILGGIIVYYGYVVRLLRTQPASTKKQILWRYTHHPLIVSSAAIIAFSSAPFTSFTAKDRAGQAKASFGFPIPFAYQNLSWRSPPHYPWKFDLESPYNAFPRMNIIS